jgi:hypothetical protein
MADRDELLQAVLARVRPIMSTGDAAAALHPDAAAEASALAAVIGEARDPDAWFALGWLHWYRFRAAPEGGDEADLDRAVQNFLPFFLGDTSAVLPRGLMPRLLDRARKMASAALGSVTESYHADRANAAVAAWQRIVQAIPD